MSPKRPARVAFARIAQESNALSPVLTTLDDFRSTHFLEGARLERACGRLGYEARGFIRNAELSGFLDAVRAVDEPIEAVPLFSAWAIPGGPLSRECFATLRDKLLYGLRAAAPLDGLFLSMHGAMNTEDDSDPEGTLLNLARDLLGPDVPIAVSLDLHANLTGPKVEAATVLASYRTNPHRDQARTGRRAGRMLLDTMAGRVRPTTAWRSLPLLLGGGRTLDFLSPMRAVFRRMREMEADPRVLDCSLNMCHPWNDHPDLGWSTYVVTDGDAALAESLADELADMAWGVRREQAPPFASPSEAIERARQARFARATGAVCFCDASDVVPAGAPGDNTRLLAALLAEGTGLLSYVPLRDPQAVAALWHRSPGDTVSIPVGGTLDPARGRPLEVQGRLAGTFTVHGFDRIAVLDLEHVQLVITEGPALVMKPAFYRDVGLDPWRADIMVVKSFFPWLLYFLPYNRLPIFVRTEGVTDLDAAFSLNFADAMYPRDAVDDWRPADGRRRGFASPRADEVATNQPFG